MIAYNHSDKIEKIDTVRAFHIGLNLFVEVDVVVNENMKIKDAHDLGESLQAKIEAVENVERAFVHLDYEWDHHPHSEHKKII